MNFSCDLLLLSLCLVSLIQFYKVEGVGHNVSEALVSSDDFEDASAGIVQNWARSLDRKFSKVKRFFGSKEDVGFFEGKGVQADQAIGQKKRESKESLKAFLNNEKKLAMARLGGHLMDKASQLEEHA